MTTMHACMHASRYLVCGAPDSASLYLRVDDVRPPHDVACTALNDASLEGLVTVLLATQSEAHLTRNTRCGVVWIAYCRP